MSTKTRQSFTIANEVLEAVKSAAETNGLNVSQTVEAILREYLKVPTPTPPKVARPK